MRRDILRIPEPMGPRHGQSGSGESLSLMLLGDSSIAGVGADTQDQALSGRLTDRHAHTHHVTWCVLGKTGWTTEDTLSALSNETPHPIDIAVISLGVNDVTTETGIATWLRSYTNLIEALRRDWRTRLLILSGLPPMGAFPALPQPLRWYMGLQADAHQNALFHRFKDDPDIVCLPLNFDVDPSAMAEDGFHPGPRVYDAWAQDLAGVIHQYLPQMPAPEVVPATGAAHPSTET